MSWLYRSGPGAANAGINDGIGGGGFIGHGADDGADANAGVGYGFSEGAFAGGGADGGAGANASFGYGLPTFKEIQANFPQK